LDALNMEMVQYLSDRLPKPELARLKAGELDVVEVYRYYHDREDGERASRVARLEDRIGDLAFKAADRPKGAVARRKFDEEIDRLEAEVAAIRAEDVPIDQRRDTAARQLAEYQSLIRTAQGHLAARRTQQATETVRGLLREARVYSIDNPLKG